MPSETQAYYNGDKKAQDVKNGLIIVL